MLANRVFSFNKSFVCLLKTNNMSTDTRLIEIKRIISDKDKNNTGSEKEAIDPDMIRGIRAWHKGKNDTQIIGDMTLIVLKPDYQMSAGSKPRTMLIEENYDDFMNRLAYKVPVHRLVVNA